MLRRFMMRRRYRCARYIGAIAVLCWLILWYRSYPSSSEEDPMTTAEPFYRLRTDQNTSLSFEDEIQESFRQVIAGAGDYGAPVHLKQRDQALADELYREEAFNIIASNYISLNRTTPDNRFEDCRSVVYDAILPSASVIIVFHNEAWSPLLRTVHTVINYSPAQYLREVILVDDSSDKVELKGKLQYYVQNYLPSKVRLIRGKKRMGLIRARLLGAKAATGSVIIFLDGHCEATTGWLEPLLHRIKHNRKTFALPIIDIINDKTMEFMKNSGSFFQIGTFRWNGYFSWMNVPEREIKRRGSVISPTRSPIMAGGLFAVDAKYFWEIGSYDEGMEIWGGENLEISFRVWMCGGQLESIPCSHVGHIFRAFHPYKFPKAFDYHGRNSIRMAEVWMDDYKRLLYLTRTHLRAMEYGSVVERKKLRQKLQCKSFKWYLDNVLPEMFILDENVKAFGHISNEKKPYMCLDMMQRDENFDYYLGIYTCHKNQTISQLISLSNNFELRRELVCAECARNSTKVLMTTCNNGTYQKWNHTKNGPLIHLATGLCMDILNSTFEDDINLSKCDGSSEQIWKFDNYLDL